MPWNRILTTDEYTAQEVKYVGGSEYDEGAKTGKPWTPIGISTGKPMDIAQVNRRRAEQKVFTPMLATSYTRNRNAALTLEPLDEEGKTIRDPQIVLFDKETGEITPSPELTKVFYTKMYEQEQLFRKEREGQNHPEWELSYYIRDTQSLLEGQQPSSIESS